MADIIDYPGPADPARGPQPDAHGQAAYLLVESLLHALIARQLLTNKDAIEIVETALDVKMEVADEFGDSAATLQRSLGLLRGIADSLRADQTD